MIVDSKSQSLEEMVYSKLEEEILTGELPTGTALGEIALSERLGVSRTPVRGALHRLSEEGLVEIIPNKGAKVIGINMEDLVDIYKIRERLEGLASALATERITDEELKELKETVDLAEFYIIREDTEHIRELDTVFHSIIYKASGNRFLSRMLSELHNKIKSYRKRSLAVPGRDIKSDEEHREILNAIISKNAQLAEELTLIHVRRALENMLASLEDNSVKNTMY